MSSPENTKKNNNRNRTSLAPSCSKYRCTSVKNDNTSVSNAPNINGILNRIKSFHSSWDQSSLSNISAESKDESLVNSNLSHVNTLPQPSWSAAADKRMKILKNFNPWKPPFTSMIKGKTKEDDANKGNDISIKHTPKNILQKHQQMNPNKPQINTIITKHFLRAPLALPKQIPINSMITVKSCRICLDSAKDNSILIAPCWCTGSIQYVHNTCLKLWIEINHKNPLDAVCEICKTKYKIRPVYKRRISRDKCLKFLYKDLILSLLLISMLSFVIFFIYEHWWTQKSLDSIKSKAIYWAIASLLLTTLIAYLIWSGYEKIKKKCFIRVWSEWYLLSSSVQKINVTNENNVSNIIMNNWHHGYVSSNHLNIGADFEANSPTRYGQAKMRYNNYMI